jgi:hypothetical protein
VKKSKTRITVALGCNATGTDKLPPLFIGFANKPRCFSAPPGELGYDYASGQKAWMTGDIFRDWLLRLETTMAGKNRFIILLLDNFSGHKAPPDDYPHIRLEFFAPNLTAHVQPCDAGLTRAFKAIYRKKFLLSIVDDFYDGNFGSDLFKIDQKKAMDFALSAWDQVSENTILNCWGHTGIVPGVKRST